MILLSIISDDEYYEDIDVAESRAINNRQNSFVGNFASIGYGNMIGNGNNLQGINKMQSNTLLNQMKNNGQLGLSHSINSNLGQKNSFSQQGANKIKKQALLQLQQQNQRLQHIRLLQMQQKQQKGKIHQINTNQLSNPYTSNNEQNELFSKLKSKNKTFKPSNTFRKSDTQNVGTETDNYGLYDYDVDYYDLG